MLKNILKYRLVLEIQSLSSHILIVLEIFIFLFSLPISYHLFVTFRMVSICFGFLVYL